jgi:hypothetical protein
MMSGTILAVVVKLEARGEAAVGAATAHQEDKPGAKFTPGLTAGTDPRYALSSAHLVPLCYGRIWTAAVGPARMAFDASSACNLSQKPVGVPV